MNIKLRNRVTNQKDNNKNEVTGDSGGTMILVERRDNLALCEGHDKKGWIFYGVDDEGLSDGGFRYPSLDCAIYGLKSQDQISWVSPPLDFGWESNASEREYDMITLCLLHELYNGEAILVDEKKQEHNRLTVMINESTEAELNALVQHIGPVINQHRRPELLS